MSGKMFSSGPYASMSYEEVISADPWYIVALAKAGGNHGISQSLVQRAERMIEEQTDPYEEYEELIDSQASTFGLDDSEFDMWEAKYG